MIRHVKIMEMDSAANRHHMSFALQAVILYIDLAIYLRNSKLYDIIASVRPLVHPKIHDRFKTPIMHDCHQ